ncbi:MAG: hypothetical protein JW903_08760 [Clostridia bacterium]|nr:hypothetical protein [Clostridia bacterium]
MPALSDIRDSVTAYDSEKHAEEFYDFYIKRIGKAVEPSEQLETDIRHLFYWFLGKVHKTAANPIETIQIGKNIYNISEAAPSNRAAIDEAVKSENLWAGLAFMNGNLPVDNLINKAKTITKNSIIIPAFFVHLFKPQEFPIFNNNVWAAYRDELGKNIFTNTRPTTWDNYLEYVSYCSYLKRRTGLSLREIDKGLWVIGEKIMEEARNKNEKETEESGQVGLFQSLEGIQKDF